MPGQTASRSVFELGAWCFFGAWSLGFGAFCLGSPGSDSPEQSVILVQPCLIHCDACSLGGEIIQSTFRTERRAGGMIEEHPVTAEVRDGLREMVEVHRLDDVAVD